MHTLHIRLWILYMHFIIRHLTHSMNTKAKEQYPTKICSSYSYSTQCQLTDCKFYRVPTINFLIKQYALIRKYCNISFSATAIAAQSMDGWTFRNISRLLRINSIIHSLTVKTWAETKMVHRCRARDSKENRSSVEDIYC